MVSNPADGGQQRIRNQKVIQSPATVFQPLIEPHRPPGIDYLCLGIPGPEHIGQAEGKKLLHPVPLLGLKPRRLRVVPEVFRIHVDSIPCHVKVSAQDRGLVQLLQKRAQGRIPGRPVVQPGKAALRVGDVDIQNVETVIFQSNQAALHVKFPDTHAVPDGKRFPAGKGQRAGVPGALGRIPELEIPRSGEWTAGFDLLAAEYVRPGMGQHAQKSLAFAGSQTVYIP